MALRPVGLYLGEQSIRATDDARPGTILDQDPPPGTRVTPKTPMRVIVASEVARVTVPDIRGRDTGSAAMVLAAAPLQLGEQLTRPTDQVAAGVVIDQDPHPGDRVKPNTPVRVWVSATVTEVVPDVVRRTRT